MKTKTTYYERENQIKASLRLDKYDSGLIKVSLFDSVKKEFVYEETFEENESDVAEKLYSISQKQLIPFFDEIYERIENIVIIKEKKNEKK